MRSTAVILDKDPASSVSFDLKDEAGHSLSLLTSEENGKISAATLKVLSKRKLAAHGFVLSEALTETLEYLARSDTTDGRAWLDRLENPIPADKDREEIECLLDERNDGGQMKWWLETLALASIVVVTFGSAPNHRRIIKIAYEQPIRRGPGLLAKMAVRSFRTWLIVPLIRSGRYHFDVKAPADFRLTQVALLDSKAGHPSKAPGFRRRAQLYIDNVHDPRGAIAMFGLRVSGRGVLGGALVAALLVLIAILACIRLRGSIAEDSGSGPALLLVLPGIIATYVARSDQHGLTTRLLAIPRWILLLFSGVAAYYAAGALALIGKVDDRLGEPKHQLAVDHHADLILQWLRPAGASAAIAVLVIGLGWICTREITHTFGRWLRRMGRRYTKARFRLEVPLPAPSEVVWEHLQDEVAKLLQAGRLQKTRTTVSPPRKCVIHRSAGPFNWTHGIEVSKAPPGTMVNWLFWADGPWLLRPLLAPLVFWELAMAKGRIAEFERVNAG